MEYSPSRSLLSLTPAKLRRFPRQAAREKKGKEEVGGPSSSSFSSSSASQIEISLSRSSFFTCAAQQKGGERRTGKKGGKEEECSFFCLRVPQPSRSCCIPLFFSQGGLFRSSPCSQCEIQPFNIQSIRGNQLLASRFLKAKAFGG